MRGVTRVDFRTYRKFAVTAGVAVLKALYYERSGFVLHNKRLTEGHFMVARSAREEALLECLSDQEFKWLLAGLPYRRLKNLPKKYMIYG